MFTAPVHLALESLAFAVGGWVYWRKSNVTSQPPDRWTRVGLLAGAALGAALGSRGLYMLQYWFALAHEAPAAWFGGKSIVGGLLGGLVGVETAKRLLNWRSSTGDGFVLPLLLGMIVGRIGCQVSGLSDLTYGNATTLPWGWDYGDGVSRHPTAAYEILGLVMLGWVAHRAIFSSRRGDRFRAFLAGYLLLRIGLEFLKPPFGPAAPAILAPGLWGPLTAIQWACVCGLAYYARDMVRWTTRGRNAEGSTVSFL